MTLADDVVRLRHLREAAQKAIYYSAARPSRSGHPDVPWSAAARMRDRLIHHYFDIDLDVLWATVVVDLPRLLEVLPRDD